MHCQLLATIFHSMEKICQTVNWCITKSPLKPTDLAAGTQCNPGEKPPGQQTINKYWKFKRKFAEV